jgi:hypothetical protein
VTRCTPLAAAASAVAVLLFARPVLARFPDAALGAIVIFAAIRLIDIQAFRRLLPFRRNEMLLALATCAADMRSAPSRKLRGPLVPRPGVAEPVPHADNALRMPDRGDQARRDGAALDLARDSDDAAVDADVERRRVK